MSEPRFDLSYGEHGASIDYHFCREWDGDDGCYGTNTNHGMSFDEAKEAMAQYHEAEAARWRAIKSFKDWDLSANIDAA